MPPETFKNKTLLELGSGTGLVGLVAAMLGTFFLFFLSFKFIFVSIFLNVTIIPEKNSHPSGASVTLTDLNHQLELIRSNWERNDPEKKLAVTIQELRWYEVLVRFLVSLSIELRGENLSKFSTTRFDFIFCCEVVYLAVAGREL